MRLLTTIIAAVSLVTPLVAGLPTASTSPTAPAAGMAQIPFKAHADAAVVIDPTSIGSTDTRVAVAVDPQATEVRVRLVAEPTSETVDVDAETGRVELDLAGVEPLGAGSVRVELTGRGRDGAPISATDEVWFDVVAGRLLVSDVGVEDLGFQADAVRAGSPGTPQVATDELRAEASDVAVVVDGVGSCPDGQICATGTARWTDRDGAVHPVRSAFVDIVEVIDGESEVRATVLTDDAGGYAANFTSSGDVDVFVRLRAAGPGFEFVVNRGGVLEPRDKVSGLRTDVAPGSSIVANFTTGQVSAGDTVFSLHDAMTHAIEYLPTLRSDPLPDVEILFPANGTFYSPATRRVSMLEADRWDWDVMLHEYGHFVAEILEIEANPGGRHSGGENLGNRLPKDEANRLAWGEGWPTYFAVSTLYETNAAALGISNIGDTSYQDTEDTFIDDDLDDAERLGEDNELTVAATLWDLYDASADFNDRTAFGTSVVWDVLDLGDPVTLSDATGLFAPDRGARTDDVNCVLSQMNVAPQLAGPATQAVPAASPLLSWIRGNGGLSGSNDAFRVEYRNADSTVALFSTSTDQTSFRAPQPVWDRIVSDAGGIVNVTVIGTATARDPLTGPYRSCARSFTSGPATAVDPLIVSVVPTRLADTRPSEPTFDGLVSADGRRRPGSVLRVPIAGRGVVGDRARAVVVNLTAVQPATAGFVTAYDCAEPMPPSSSLNHVAGVDVANEVIVALGSDGDICLFTSTFTDLVVDVVGYVEWASPLVTVTPARLLETRSIDTGTTDGGNEGVGRLLADSELTIPIAGRAGVADDAVAAIVNVAAVEPRRAGFVTVHPCEENRPLAASLNVSRGVDRASEIVAPLDADGNICLYTSGSIHAIVDVVGYVPPTNDYDAMVPARFVDTRPGERTADAQDQGIGRRADGATTVIQVAGRNGVPFDATAVVAYVTAVNPGQPGFVTVWRCDEPRPLASSLNHDPGVDGGNELIAELDGAGRLCLFTRGSTHLTVDVAGHIDP